MASDPLWRKTPLVESRALSETTGCRVFLKLENLQPSGSFKSRGIGNLMLSHVKTKTTSPHFYSSSGGNAGLACVVAAASLGHPATVVVPMTTKKMMIDKIEQGGARQVIQHGLSWREADEYLRDVVMKRDADAVYVPPFDHAKIWEGNATIVDEILEQLRELTTAKTKVNGADAHAADVMSEMFPLAIVCSVGGGGLFNGIVQGLERYSSSTPASHVGTQVIAVETAGAASLHQSLAQRKHITLSGITSAATSLGATRVAAETFNNGQKPFVHSVSMSDVHAEAGCLTLARTDHLLVELACGVNVTMCQKQYLKQALGREVRQDEKIVIVVCGGSNITVDMLAQWKSDLAQRQLDGIADEPIAIVHGKDY